jgi:hypothetical protein
VNPLKLIQGTYLEASEKGWYLLWVKPEVLSPGWSIEAVKLNGKREYSLLPATEVDYRIVADCEPSDLLDTMSR